MQGIKKFLIYSNPIGWVIGIPILVGMLIGGMGWGMFSNTHKVIKQMSQESREKNRAMMIAQLKREGQI